jgi:hypothetical protein
MNQSKYNLQYKVLKWVIFTNIQCFLASELEELNSCLRGWDGSLEMHQKFAGKYQVSCPVRRYSYMGG